MTDEHTFSPYEGIDEPDSDDQRDDRQFTIQFSTGLYGLGEADPLDPSTATTIIRDRLDALEQTHNVTLIVATSQPFGGTTREYIIRGYTPGHTDSERLAELVQRELHDVRYAIEAGDKSEIRDHD